MNITSGTTRSVILLATMIAAGIIGCAQIREVTYPQGFSYLDNKQVETLMQQMGSSMARLDELVTDAPAENTIQQQEIIAELNKLEGYATQLSGGHRPTNQFLISEHIEDFIGDIGTAKMFAKLNPPKYYKIEYVTHACDQCHRLR